MEENLPDLPLKLVYYLEMLRENPNVIPVSNCAVQDGVFHLKIESFAVNQPHLGRYCSGKQY